MKTMKVMEALREAMCIRMREDQDVLLMGEDVGRFGGCFGVSAGMFDEFGPERVRDTPISEGAIIGAATGSAAAGLRPIAEIMFSDFLTVAMDQLVNNAAFMHYMFGGKIELPMVVRTVNGAGAQGAAQHSKSMEAWVTHIPGLKVVFPSIPQDCLGLMLASIDDDNPVIFFEHKMAYGRTGEVTSLDPIPLGTGDIKREGSDVTIVAYGNQLFVAMDAAEELAKGGISAEVLDPRTLYPLDKELIATSVAKTGNVIVTSEEFKRGSYAGEISAFISEELFDSLDSPVRRVCALDTPVPFAPILEQAFLPKAEDIVQAVREQLG